MSGNSQRVLKKWKNQFDWGYTFNCGICKMKIERRDDITVDHIYPSSLGGTNNRYNFQPAHAKCNHRRGNKPIETVVIQGGYTPATPKPKDNP